jgi:hypothetical protein
VKGRQSDSKAYGTTCRRQKSNPLIDSVCRYCRKDVETPIHLIKNCEALTLKRLEIFRAGTLPDDFDWSPDQVLDFIKSTGVWTMMERQPKYL